MKTAEMNTTEMDTAKAHGSMKAKSAVIKRLAATCACLLLIAPLAGCGGSSAPAPSAPAEPAAAEPAPAFAEPAAEPAPEPAPADGSSGSDGSRIFFSIDGGEMPNSDEEYLEISENEVAGTDENPMLTFSLKVDSASYRNAVRYIESGSIPPSDAVRTEEMINYFTYDTPLEENGTPFSIYAEIGASPFSEERNLAFVRVKSKDIDTGALPPSNLTFLIDTSGSMSSADKLPLLQASFGMLADTLGEGDRVSIVTYSGDSRIALDSADGGDKERITEVINRLAAGGGTAGGAGIQTAYSLAEKNFIEGGNNRVILATDGDFNVGVASVGELERLITEKRGTGVYLSVLGFGAGNIKDSIMETLAANGNGNYSYIDSSDTARRVLVDELAANLFVIADDVKAQVEFNPALVSDYRLIGYENRRMSNRDFTNDAKDAGEIGAGTDVVLMFELTLADGGGLKYGGTEPAPGEYGDEFFEVRIRYKEPGGSESKLITVPVKTDRLLDTSTGDFNFASSVAAFGHLLRGSQYSGSVRLDKIIEVASGNQGADREGLRGEFVRVLRAYEGITEVSAAYVPDAPSF